MDLKIEDEVHNTASLCFSPPPSVMLSGSYTLPHKMLSLTEDQFHTSPLSELSINLFSTGRGLGKFVVIIPK